MKHGHHGDRLGASFDHADITYVYQPSELDWNPENLASMSEIQVVQSSDELLRRARLRGIEKTAIICMSNGGFDGIPGLVREHLESSLVKDA